MLSRALHCLHDGVAVVDTGGIILYANPALVELVGEVRGALEGQPIDGLVTADGDAEERAPKKKTLSFQGRTVRQGTVLHASGERIPVRWSAILVSDPEAGVFHTYVFHDLRPDIRLERLEDRLRHSERLTLLGQVFGGLAHELNNPLTHIMIGSELMLAAGGDPEKVAEHATRIQGAADRCRRILQNALRVIHKGSEEAEPARQDLREPIQEIVDVVQRPFSYDGVEVEFAVAAGTPPVTFDRTRIQQVVTNLLNNARDALSEEGRRGRVAITVGPRPDGSGAILAVTDDGPGLPPEVREKVGRAFFTTKPAGKGTGLGLSICRTVVEEHGGELRLVHPDAGGLRVEVDLPTDPPADRDAAARPAGLEGSRVLVIDDDPDARDALGSRFGSLGVIEVVVAADPGHALQLMGEQEFDLVVCDLRLPGMSGVTLYRIASVAFPRLARRFLFVSGFPEDDETAGFLARQRLKRLSKPLDGPTLAEAAERVLFSQRES